MGYVVRTIKMRNAYKILGVVVDWRIILKSILQN
jgi:hypothetical protein